MAKGTSVERQRRAFVPDEAWLAKQAREEILETDLPIIDPHHHLWDHLNNRHGAARLSPAMIDRHFPPHAKAWGGVGVPRRRRGHESAFEVSDPSVGL
jgi:hypothetical protein